MDTALTLAIASQFSLFLATALAPLDKLSEALKLSGHPRPELGALTSRLFGFGFYCFLNFVAFMAYQDGTVWPAWAVFALFSFSAFGRVTKAASVRWGASE